MNVAQPSLWLAQARVAIARAGAVNSLACLLCAAGAIAWTQTVPGLEARLDAGQKTLATMRSAAVSAQLPPPVAPRSRSEERLAQFFDNLGEQAYREQQVRSLFAIAAKNNLVLSQAQYKLGFDKHGRYYTYQIDLPVKGSYEAIREFSEQTLLAIPFASLSEISFQRESIDARTLEAKLRLTLYLRDDSVASPTAPGTGRGHDA